jgi:hypothetical protein
LPFTFDGAGVDRWPVAHQLLAERLHPRVILVELLAAGDGAPWDVSCTLV